MAHPLSDKAKRKLARKLQNEKDYKTFLNSRGFNGCATLAIVQNKMRGANHKKLYVESTTKQHFASFSNK